MKKLQFQIYNTAGTFVTNWNDATLQQFTKSINGGLGECIIKRVRNINNWNDDSDIGLNYIIKIYITDVDSTTQVKIYEGFISTISFIANGVEEFVEIHCLGYVARMAMDYYKNGTTITITETSADPSQMLKNIIVRMKAENSQLSNIGYTATSIETTGLSLDYKFESMTYLDSINKCLELAPSNWYWYLDQNNVFYFKAKPSSSTHNFIFRTNIQSFEIDYSIENIVNETLIWDGQVAGNYRSKVDTQSQNSYARRVKKLIMPNINADVTSMDAIADSILEENRDPKVKGRVVIIDNNENTRGYNIESIEPGDTCNLIGVPVSAGSFLKTNLFIRSVTYSINSVIVEVEDWKPDKMEDIITNLNRDLSEERTTGIPTIYTQV